MKYTILINQAGVADAGYANGKTDLIDWAILDYIHDWQSNPRSLRMGDLVWINYKHLISQMPLLGLNNKQAVSKRIIKIEKLGLINCEHDTEKRLFAKLSNTAHSMIKFRLDRQPNDLGVNHGGQGCQPQLTGGVNHGGHSVDISVLVDNQDIDRPASDPPPEGLQTVNGKPKRKPPRCQIPDDWEIIEGDGNHLYAVKCGMTWADIETQEAKFINYHKAKGSVMADWDAAWRTWCGNFNKYREAKLGWQSVA